MSLIVCCDEGDSPHDLQNVSQIGLFGVKDDNIASLKDGAVILSSKLIAVCLIDQYILRRHTCECRFDRRVQVDVPPVAWAEHNCGLVVQDETRFTIWFQINA